MKKLSIFLFACFTCAYINAQETKDSNGSLQFGINGAFYGAGDLIGPSIYGEYVYHLNDYFSIAPRMFGGFASRYNEFEGIITFDQISSFGINTSLRYTPLPHFFNSLKIDAGPLYHSMINSYGETSYDPGYQTYSQPYFYSDNLFGLSGSILLDLIQNERTDAGVRFDILTSFTESYYNCDSFQLGVYLRVKL